MAVSNYSRGAAFENRTQARLEEQGWFVVRSAGSKTLIDLVAVKADEQPLFVQCKSGSRSLSRNERTAFVEFARAKGAVPVLVERGLKFTFLSEAA